LLAGCRSEATASHSYITTLVEVSVCVSAGFMISTVGLFTHSLILDSGGCVLLLAAAVRPSGLLARQSCIRSDCVLHVLLLIQATTVQFRIHTNEQQAQ
jgi:hypothetical protein